MKRIRVFVWILTTVLIGLAVSAGPRPVFAQDDSPVCEDTDGETTCKSNFSGCTQDCGEDAVEGSKYTCTPGEDFVGKDVMKLIPFVHLDSSSFHLHGAYDPDEPEREAISVTHGYSKDHRPVLKQVVLQLITHHKSALPVWLEVLSGNSNNKKTFKATIKAYCKQLSAEEQAYVVMDSAEFSEETLKEVRDIFWMMRVPETLAQAKKLVKETPAEEMVELSAGYWGEEVACEYAGIQQRWLV